MTQNIAEQIEVPQEETQEEQVQQAEQEEQAEEPKAEEPEKKKESVVPYGALHEERQKRKEIQAELQRIQNEQQQRYSMMEQRLQQIQQAAYQQQAPKAPSYEDDPIGALKYSQDLTQEQLRQIQAYQQQEYVRQQQEYQQRQFQTRLENTVRSDVARFSAETPDYLDALNFARQVRVKQHMALGMEEQEAIQTMLNEEYQLSYAALQRGRSPAEAAYEIAKTYGWKQKAPEPQQKIETLQKGVAASKTLASGGTPPKGGLSLEALADLSDDEFAEYMKSGKWSKLGD